MSTTLEETVFAREGQFWRPREEAAGPFGGLHGGAVSGLLVAEMEWEAREQGFGVPLSANVALIRAAPMADLEVRTEVLRKGARVGVIEAAMLADDKIIAKGIASFVTAAPVEGAPAQALQPFDPSDLPPWRSRPRFKHKTLFDTHDIRDDGRGTKWTRLTRSLVPFAAPFASVVSVADNGTPFSLHTLGLFPPPYYNFPNINITVHVARAPVAGWIGVEAKSDWRDGRGLTEAMLYDEAGVLGRGCQTVVLVPRS
jgi:hypothetical protein